MRDVAVWIRELWANTTLHFSANSTVLGFSHCLLIWWIRVM
jgi:hypothetical protein